MGSVAHRIRGRVSLCGWLVAVATIGRVGHTQGPAAEDAYVLHVQAAGECGSADDVRRRIDALVGGRPSAAESVVVEVQMEVTDTGWAVAITVERAGAVAQRRLAASTCEAALEAASLVAAMAIDPEALGPDPDRDPDPEPEPTPDVVPAAQPEPVPARDPDPDSSPDSVKEPSALRVAADLGGGVAVGVVPGASGLLRAAASLGTRKLGGDVRGELRPAPCRRQRRIGFRWGASAAVDGGRRRLFRRPRSTTGLGIPPLRDVPRRRDARSRVW